MNTKIKLRIAVDIGLIITFLIVFVTGIIKFKDLMFAIGVSYQGLPMRDISLWHDWCGLLFGILAVAHLILEYKWLTCMLGNLLKGNKNKCDTI